MNGHQSVLLQEAVACLNVKEAGIYVDATFGRGGHSREILKKLGRQGLLLAIDKDPEAVQHAQANFGHYGNFKIRQGSFGMLQIFANELGIAQNINGILLDLGVSSPQLDEPRRGFSFLHDGPLDMRMDPSQPMSAATWINSADEAEIARVLRQYGEERFAKRIAKAIVQERAIEPFLRTLRLANVIKEANPAWEKHKHPATRSFQAIRIFINSELQDLSEVLQQSLDNLVIGGRLVVISFHSLEDRIVKNFIQKEERGGDFPRGLPITQEQLSPRLRRVAWGVGAKDQEISENPRSRSAILRVAEKIR
jgi:16S rRNA (cytosine1402-N4)-methyltransferase